MGSGMLPSTTRISKAAVANELGRTHEIKTNVDILDWEDTGLLKKATLVTPPPPQHAFI